MKVLVTGATGSQGGAVAEHLLRRGVKVRALVRQPHSTRAQELEAQGAELVQGDYDDEESLDEAAGGMDGLFAVLTPFEEGVETEIRQGKALIDCAHEAGIRHLVYSSVASAERKTGIPHFESKYQLEQYLRKSRVPFTIVGPTFFRENYLGAIDALQSDGIFSMPLALDRPLQTVSRDELGAFVAQVFEKGLIGQRIELASDETTGPEMAAAFERALGRPVRYRTEGLEQVMSAEDDMGLMWAWLNRVGYTADVMRLRRDFPQVPWKSFAEWARELAAEAPQPAAP